MLLLSCRSGFRVLMVLCLVAPGFAAWAGEDVPLWEVGAGVAGVSFPSYRGSDQSTILWVPVPYFTYHGDFLKSDRHGTRASLLDTDALDLTISMALSPPASSDAVTARTGMPDLAATFEIGPQADITVWRSANRSRVLKLELPLRSAVTLENSVQDIGWVFHPKLNLDITDVPGLPGWNLGMQLGPLFGDQRQNAYLYSVAPQYATANRLAYEARAGYAGMQYLASFSKRYQRFWIGGFVRYDNLGGAVFQDSPLVRQKDYVAGGFSVVWMLGESATRVRLAE